MNSRSFSVVINDRNYTLTMNEDRTVTLRRDDGASASYQSDPDSTDFQLIPSTPSPSDWPPLEVVTKLVQMAIVALLEEVQNGERADEDDEDDTGDEDEDDEVFESKLTTQMEEAFQSFNDAEARVFRRVFASAIRVDRVRRLPLTAIPGFLLVAAGSCGLGIGWARDLLAGSWEHLLLVLFAAGVVGQSLWYAGALTRRALQKPEQPPEA